jgi:hypothetical protein
MKKPTFIFALAPWLARACVEFFLATMVLIVGGVVYWQLYHTCKTVLPPPAKNQFDPDSQFVLKYEDAQGHYLGEAYGTINPYTFFFAGLIPPASPLGHPPLSFSVRYGLDALSAPWIAPGVAQTTNPFVTFQELTNTATEYACAVTIMDRTLFYFTTNVDTEDTAGDETWLVTNTPTPVTIERTLDFVSWTPLETNYALAGAPGQTFTDTNAPSDHAFYRLTRP